MANGVNVNYCIENSATINKVPYLMRGEYTPAYPANCMIYGIDRTCFRCSLGYFKLNVNYGSGYGTGVDTCVAKDTTYGACDQSKTGSLSLTPFLVKFANTNYLTVDKFEHCGAKTIANTNNFDIVQGHDIVALNTNGTISQIGLMCKQFATLIPASFASIHATKYSNINPFSTAALNATQINWIGGALDVFPIVDCLSDATLGTLFFQVDNTPANAANTVAGSTLTAANVAAYGYSRDFSQLEYWMQRGTNTNYYTKARCGRNKVGNIAVATLEGGNSYGFVQCGTTLDSTHATYDNSVWY